MNKFRRLKNFFGTVTWSGVTFKGTDIILVRGTSHQSLVKVGDPYTKTQYTHIYPDVKLLTEILNVTDPVSRKEIRKLRHHMTRRIWMWDGVFECIDWQVLNKQAVPKKSKLLPPVMCYDCMFEGNKYIPKQLKGYTTGLCRCCQKENTRLYLTRIGWPIDLRHKGFGFTVIMTGDNYTTNTEYYNAHFDMSIYDDYTGQSPY